MWRCLKSGCYELLFFIVVEKEVIVGQVEEVRAALYTLDIQADLNLPLIPRIHLKISRYVK